MPALSSSMMAQRSRVAGVAKMGPEKPSFTSRGSRPLWSMCAWLSTTASTAIGSNPKCRFFASLSFPSPWNMPQSSSTRRPFTSSRCLLPVTMRAAPWKVMRMDMCER